MSDVVVPDALPPGAARTAAALRIGELARRTGVPVATLRAWESRYELLDPVRTDGGHRLYREEDVARVSAVVGLVRDGWSPAAAAREVLRAPGTVTRLRPVPPLIDTAPTDDAPAADALAARLDLAIRAMDAAATDAVLDDAFARFEVPAALERVVAPVLRRLGEGWQQDARLIALEHFATNALRPRLQRLLRAGQRPGAPTCLAAAPATEDHELGVLSAAAVAADRGLAVTYLGARTPAAAIARSVADRPVDIVLIGAMTRAGAASFLDEPPDVGTARLVLGGAGFRSGDTSRVPGALHAASLSSLPEVLEQALRPRGTSD
jgi:MerR family transcriptional regulator, light-induced transcriptional regulator